MVLSTLVTDPPREETDGQLKQGTDKDAWTSHSHHSWADKLTRAKEDLGEFAKQFLDGSAGQLFSAAVLRAAVSAHAPAGGPRGGSLEDHGVLHHAELHDEEADGERDVGVLPEVGEFDYVLGRGSYRCGRADPPTRVQKPKDRTPEKVQPGVPKSVGDFAKIAFPIARRVFAQSIAQQIVSVQPMSTPSGNIFFNNYTYGQSPITVTLTITYDKPDWRSGPEWCGDP